MKLWAQQPPGIREAVGMSLGPRVAAVSPDLSSRPASEKLSA